MKVVRVAAAIIVEDGRVLACQRGPGNMEGGWEFPGGKVEPGETPEQACCREVGEELGIAVGIDGFFSHVTYSYNDFDLSMDCYACHVEQGSIELREHTSMRWLDTGTLMDVAWLPADIKLVESIRASGLLASS